MTALSARRWTRERINACCIMMEGLFNTLGNDIVGATTIVPLFLSDLGAGMGLIGALSTMRSVIGAVTPLACGQLVAGARSKRTLSLIVNGVGRGAMLLVPLALMMGARGPLMIALFFAIMLLFSLAQPVTGISWNYLLGSCVPPDQRGKLLGALFGVSGAITFGSSAVIKAIRASSLASMDQYTAIFALGGAMMALSVLCYLPLREGPAEVPTREERNPRAYLASLLRCFENRDYNWAIGASACSNLAQAAGAFFFLFAQNTLGLAADQVSNLIIAQTLGIMLGGLATGRVSARLGLKRMLMLAEAVAAFAPALALAALCGGPAFPLMAVGALCWGFSRSGMVGYQAYILEVAEPGKSIYYIVSRSMAMLPLSLAGVAVGAYLQGHSFAPVLALQILCCIGAVCCNARLKLTVYHHEQEGPQ